MILALFLVFLFQSKSPIIVEFGDLEFGHWKRVTEIANGKANIKFFGNIKPSVGSYSPGAVNECVLGDNLIRKVAECLILLKSFSGDFTRETYSVHTAVVRISSGDFSTQVLYEDIKDENGWKNIERFKNSPEEWQGYREAILVLTSLDPYGLSLEK